MLPNERDGFVTLNTMEVGDYTLGPNYNFLSGLTPDQRRQKNQFWEETQEVLSDDNNDVWPGPNNPFGGPNAAAAVLRDVDKRKESGRFVFEGD